MMDQHIFPDVPAVVHEAVLEALDNIEEKKTGRYLPKAAAGFLVFFLASAVTVTAAGVVKSYRQRMAEMSKQDVLTYYATADAAEVMLYNREFTAQEWERYNELGVKYEENLCVPEGEILSINSADEYTGNGVAMDMNHRTLYLPLDRNVSDEELLQIIDLNHKIDFSIYRANEENLLTEAMDYEKRFEQMTDEEVDAFYQVLSRNHSEISGEYSRALSADEQARYDELEKQFVEEGVYSPNVIEVIETPYDYTGDGVVRCAVDGMFYLPEHEVTDDEFLQIIDYQMRELYVYDRISYDIMMGFRDGYPIE